MRPWTLTFTGALFLLLACSTGKTPVGGEHDASKGRPAPAPVPGAPPAPAQAAPAPQPPLAVAEDLIRNLSEATLDSGGTLADLGAESGDAATLGGWTSGWKGRGDENGTTFRYAASSVCRLWIWSDQAGGGTLAIRARGEGALTGKAYLNDKLLGTFEMKRNEWLLSEIPFEAGLREGQNEVLFRFHDFRTVAGGMRAAAAVDYVRVSMDETEGGPEAGSLDAIRTDIQEGGRTVAGLRLEPGERLSYEIPLPAGSALRLTLKGESADSRLTVSLRADGVEPRDAAQLEAKPDDWRDETVALDIRGEDETWYRIDLAAEGSGSTLIRQAQVLAPPKPATARVEPPSQPWRNAILVLIDALRFDRVKALAKTATVDGIPVDGAPGQVLLFENAYAAENWTKPSVASLLTGRFPSHHGTKTTEAVLPTDIPTLASHLRRQGFDTAALMANGYLSTRYGFGRDWGHFFNYVQSGKPNRAEFIYADAQAWIKTVPPDHRFFMYIHAIDPHVPYIPPDRYIKEIDPQPYKGIVEPRKTADQIGRAHV